jgi:hypothetical protein
MNATGIRCENDVKIEQTLLNDVTVKRVEEHVDRLTAKLALQFFGWTRHAEISADRARAYCANDLDGGIGKEELD